jgi:hypothetical protein
MTHDNGKQQWQTNKTSQNTHITTHHSRDVEDEAGLTARLLSSSGSNVVANDTTTAIASTSFLSVSLFFFSKISRDCSSLQVSNNKTKSNRDDKRVGR